MHFRTSQTAYSHNAIGALVPPRSGCQYNAARQGTDALQHLADHVVARHYPEATASDRRYTALLGAVIARQAGLVARWRGVGVIYGVMNTGHMSITGETVDYGPRAFMDAFHPGRVYSSIDRGGRYAYGNQPRIAQWNLSRLAQASLPLLNEDPDKAIEEAQGAIDGFPERFEHAYLACFRAKLGLVEAHEGDAELIDTLLQAMSETGADFTNTFRALCDAAEGAEGPFRAQLGEAAILDAWLARWQARLAQESANSNVRAAAARRASPAVMEKASFSSDVIDHCVGAFAALTPLAGQTDALARHSGHPEWQARSRERTASGDHGQEPTGSL